MKSRSVKSPSLYATGFFHDFCIVLCTFFSSLCLELAWLHPWNLDKYIDTIEDRTREASTIPFDRMGTTDTGFLWITHIPTWAGVHGSHEGKSRWIPCAHIHTIDRDFTIFEWLSEGLEDMFVELEKFVEKEDSLMSEGDLSWPRVSSTTDDRCFTRGMVDDTKWPLSDNRHISCEESCDGVYLRELDLFLEFHRWEDTSECFRKHRFPRSWRTLHEDVVSASCCDEEGAFRLFLAMDRCEVYDHPSTRKRLDIEFRCGNYRDLTLEYLYDLREIRYGDDIDPRDDRCLFAVCDREKYPLHPDLSGEDRRREGSLDSPDHAIEGELSEKKRTSEDLLIELDLFREDAESDREIVDRSLLTEVCGSEIDGDASPSGEAISRVLHCSSDTLT